MSDETFRACVERIRTYCLLSGQQAVNIVFHGGEPCLAGPAQNIEVVRLCGGEAQLGRVAPPFHPPNERNPVG